MAAVGMLGADFRKQRLQEATGAGAEIMAIYCHVSQSVFAPEGPNLSIKVESIESLS